LKKLDSKFDNSAFCQAVARKQNDLFYKRLKQLKKQRSAVVVTVTGLDFEACAEVLELGTDFDFSSFEVTRQYFEWSREVTNVCGIRLPTPFGASLIFTATDPEAAADDWTDQDVATVDDFTTAFSCGADAADAWTAMEIHFAGEALVTLEESQSPSAVDVIRTAATAVSLVDPTGISSTIAAYSWDTCDKLHHFAPP
jgi:hypothetical protein